MDDVDVRNTAQSLRSMELKLSCDVWDIAEATHQFSASLSHRPLKAVFDSVPVFETGGNVYSWKCPEFRVLVSYAERAAGARGSPPNSNSSFFFVALYDLRFSR